MATPAIGDRRHYTSSAIPPIAYYPKHRFSSPLEPALRSTYAYAQERSRFLGSQSYGYDLRDPFGDQNNVIRALTSSTYVPVARFRRTMPEEINFVHGELAVAVHSLGRCTLYTRLTVAGAATDQNEDELVIDATDGGTDFSLLSQNEQARRRALFPFSSGYDVRYVEAICELRLNNITNPGRCRITLEAFATHDVSGAAAGVQPMMAQFFGEMVY